MLALKSYFVCLPAISSNLSLSTPLTTTFITGSVLAKICQIFLKILPNPGRWFIPPPPPIKVDATAPQQKSLEKIGTFIKNHYGKILFAGLFELGRAYAYQQVFTPSPPSPTPTPDSFPYPLIYGTAICALIGNNIWHTHQTQSRERIKIESTNLKHNVIDAQERTIKFLTDLELQIKKRMELIPSLSPDLSQIYSVLPGERWHEIQFEENTFGQEIQKGLRKFWGLEIQGNLYHNELYPFSKRNSKKCCNNQKILETKYNYITALLKLSKDAENLFTIPEEELAEKCPDLVNRIVYEVTEMRGRFMSSIQKFVEKPIAEIIQKESISTKIMRPDEILKELKKLYERWPVQELIDHITSLDTNFIFIDNFVGSKFSPFLMPGYISNVSDDRTLSMLHTAFSIRLSKVYSEMIATLKALEKQNFPSKRIN